MTTRSSAVSQFLVEPAGGKVVMEGPLGVITKIPGTATNGVISIVEHPVAPDSSSRRTSTRTTTSGHTSSRVASARGSATTSSSREAGSYILKPRQIPHVFWNPDDGPARILEIITPSGLEEMFARFGELGARGELNPRRWGARPPSTARRCRWTGFRTLSGATGSR